MNFDNFCSFFECHSILAEKQQTKQTHYGSLNLSTSLDTQETLQDGITVEWKKFWQEITVWKLIGFLAKKPMKEYSKLRIECQIFFYFS